MDAVATNSVEVIAAGSKSFSAAARLFNPRMRESASMLYAWCRHCDDVIDEQDLGFATDTPSGGTVQQRYERLRSETQAAIDGQPTTEPAFAALQRVVQAHDIPERHPFELLDGFAMDASDRQYETPEDVFEYCYHVAGVVGVMMSMVMGARERETLIRAADLGIAFQLTNISRDVLDDAAIGRVYLPGQWLDEAGIPRDQVAAPAHRTALAGVVSRLLDAAEPYYQSSSTGLQSLPFRAAWAIATARGVYREIGRKVARKGPRAWDSRVTVSRGRKIAWVVAGAWIALKAHSLDRLRRKTARPTLWVKPGIGEP